ncbi:unnamed protein product (macronuclear) [Paramecium tetraurelia]|uniref:serine--tRNA ligase n=1 Tax=Paramecium tetraurelia TaxID=5888 RepID=A0C4T6_PARTE|nr:uncharacterized protein GSPATT00006302001 [Paramecium tetraurelia]CAK65803.1 unnamed protein product [Paramecium tetraurelia]|eukprot:XP_001433200.1 hypothetical protein (macronuclear) [Paramecium tetraurelia strain d4-2]
MGLDINLLREDKGGNPNLVKEWCQKRFQDPAIVDKVVALDQEWRKARFNLDQLNKEYGIANKKIAEKKKANKQDPCVEEVEQAKAIDLKIKEAQKVEQEQENILTKTLNKIGNLVHESVPVSKDEAENRIEVTWGQIPNIQVNSTPGRCHHHEILFMIDGVDLKRGSKIAGHRAYFLKGPGLLLNQALVSYGIQFLNQRGYTPVQTPYFMKKTCMAETAQLSDFDDQLYKVTGNQDDEDLYLIATSEQPISAMYRKEWLEAKDLPIKYGGSSTCFRKEAGAHGKDVWGIFRVHQFEKIEQFVICPPEESWKFHEEMITAGQDFVKSLELPYRVVNIVSGALNDAAAKKYDLEAWFPGYKDYRELQSCSNCLDYQSRALEIRYGAKKADEKEKKYVHMLNATLCATERTLCCILENYQTETGVKVPAVLQPYVGKDFIPYVKPLPKKEDLGA